MLPLLFVLVAAAQSSTSRTPVKDLCEVEIDSPRTLERLFALASDPDDHTPVTDGKARIYATADEEERLARAGFRLTVVQKDLAAFYAARAAQSQGVLPPVGSMGGFRTLAEILTEMDRLATTYPAIVSPKYSIGTSLEGRPIWAMRVSTTPTVDDPTKPVAWLDAIHHAREPMSGEALLELCDWIVSRYPSDPNVRRMVDTRNIVFVPCVNPDGYEYNRQTNPTGGGLWRKNRRDNGDGTFGVDLNRNYGWQWGPQWNGSSGVTSNETYRGPSAFSEPETRVIRDAVTAHRPGMAISAHTYGNLWIYPWGYDSVVTNDDATFHAWGQVMCGSNGFLIGTVWQVLYLANGVSADWGYGQLGTFFFSPEIGSSSDGFWPNPAQIPALFESVRPGFLDAIQWTGGWAQKAGVQWTQVQGDGDAFLEPGETWDLHVQFTNLGVLPDGGGVTLSSPSPDVVVLLPSTSFHVPAAQFTASLGGGSSPAGAHQPAVHLALPLRVQFGPNAQVGVTYDLTLGVQYHGLSTTETLPVRLGAPRLLAMDDMEVSNYGWQVTSDGANYAWQRAVPQQTTSSGQTAQPGNDDPAGTGTQCWVTGAAAGSGAGSNDVDGTTVLTSPRFMASGFTHLELDYARWYADLTVLDDHLLVQVSNDDGATWTQLENPGNDNTWRTMSFDLENVLTLSDRMRLRFTAADVPSNSVCEGLIDDVVLRTYSALPTLGVWGATPVGAGARLWIDGPPNVAYRVRISTQQQPGQTTPGTQGLLYLAGTITDVATGTTGANGRANIPWTVPSGSSAFYLQVLLDENGAQAAWSNLSSVSVP